jgi:hypothetical protein
MGQDHWKSWACAFGCAGSFTTREIWHKHMRAAHSQEISSTELSLLEAGSVHKELNKVIGNCPLCVTENIRDSWHYRTHIGHHLESLALFSLPRIEGNDDTDEGSMVRSDLGPEAEAQHEDDSSNSSGIPTTSPVKEALRRHAEQGSDSDTETTASRNDNPSTLILNQRFIDAFILTEKEVEAKMKDIGALDMVKAAQIPIMERLAKLNRQQALHAKEIVDATKRAKKENEKLKERLAAESPTKEEAAAVARAQQAARDYTEAERRADEKQKELGVKAVAKAQQAAQDQIKAELTVDEESREREHEPAAAAEAAATSSKLEAVIKGNEEADVVTLRKKMHKEADTRRLVEGQAKLWALSDGLEKEHGKQTDEPANSSENLPRKP